MRDRIKLIALTVAFYFATALLDKSERTKNNGEVILTLPDREQRYARYDAVESCTDSKKKTSFLIMLALPDLFDK